MGQLLANAPDKYDRQNEQLTRRSIEDAISDLQAQMYAFQTTAGTLRMADGDLTLVNGANNNVAPGYSTYARVNGPSASFTITGISDGELGRFLILRNTTAQQMTIVNESASSTAANRIRTMSGTDLVLPTTNGATVVLEYDATLARWVVLAHRPSDTGTAGALLKANNLSDLASTATAITNLGVLTKANNLSDVASASTSRTNLGLGTAAVQNVAAFLQPSNNLSDVAHAGTSRTNLGLGSIATLAAGVTTVASGNLNSGASLVVNNLPTTYAMLILTWTTVTCDTAARTLLIQLSADNGSTFDTTAANYVGMYSNGTTVAVTNLASIVMSGSVAAAAVRNGHVALLGVPFSMSAFGNNLCLGYSDDGSTPWTSYVSDKGMVANAVKFLWSGSGNFNGSGTYALLGVR